MKMIVGLGFALLLLQSCHNSSEKKVDTPPPPVETRESPAFFPVTDYIKGQIREITEKQVNPIKYVTIKGHTDSSWLKMEELPAAFDDFLHPEIDSMNLISLFKETKFMDQTINAVTFTYDPIATLPDSMHLEHWDLYIDPATGKIKRVYMVKTAGEGRIRQLTWQGDRWCKIVDIVSKADGTSAVEKEVKITWEF